MAKRYILTGSAAIRLRCQAGSNTMIYRVAADAVLVIHFLFIVWAVGGGLLLLAGWHRADLRTREALHVPATPIYAGCGESPTLPVSETCPSCVGSFSMSIVYDITLDGLEPYVLAAQGMESHGTITDTKDARRPFAIVKKEGGGRWIAWNSPECIVTVRHFPVSPRSR